jgi:hypothetical protein
VTYAVEMDLYIPSFINIGSGIEELLGGRGEFTGTVIGWKVVSLVMICLLVSCNVNCRDVI